MKNVRMLFSLNVSIIDVAFGILLGIMFERYSIISSTASRVLFFLTLAVTINYYYTYRKWVERIGLNVRSTVLLDIVADLGMVFFGYQLVQTFNDATPARYYTWFMVLFIMDALWVAERLFAHHISRFQLNIFRFWIITDLMVFSALLAARRYFLGLDRIFPILLLMASFLVTFALDPFYERLIKKMSLLRKSA